jgi:hypothetical protein
LKLIARLKGGVGNQLFIYAAAYAFCRTFGYKLYIDGESGFIKDKYRRANKLHSFRIESTSMSGKAMLYFTLKKISPILSLFCFRNTYELLERDSKDVNPFKLPDPLPSIIFFDGLWQSPEYFRSYRSEILRQLEFKNVSNFKTNALFNIIVSSESVAVHVRRVQYNNVLDLDYYFKAMDLLESKAAKLTYFIFSDDVSWCKATFNGIENIIFVDYPDQNDIEDLFLMTKCKYFIIANSSFSWWGAWLSTSENKVVIAPNKLKMNECYYPYGWIQID